MSEPRIYRSENYEGQYIEFKVKIPMSYMVEVKDWDWYTCSLLLRMIQKIHQEKIRKATK